MVFRRVEDQGELKWVVSVESIVWITLFVLLPLSIAFVAALPLHIVEFIVFFVAAGASVLVYWLLQRRDVEENRAIAAALGISLIIVFATLVFVGHSLDVNVLGNYAPHFGNIAAWAFPTLMWFRAREYLTQNEYADGRSEATIEAIGFGVALLYTVVYSLMEANLAEPVEYLLVVLLLLWLMMLSIESLIQAE